MPPPSTNLAPRPDGRYGISNNLRNHWDNTPVKFLGDRPQGYAADEATTP